MMGRLFLAEARWNLSHLVSEEGYFIFPLKILWFDFMDLLAKNATSMEGKHNKKTKVLKMKNWCFLFSILHEKNRL